MTWSYVANPAASPTATVHFLIGDTDTTDQVASDEECAWALSVEGNSVWLAAANVAEAKARSYARLASKVRVGDTSVDYGERARDYLELSQTLRLQAAIQTARVYAGGISQADKDLEVADTDRVKPIFTRKKQDFLGTGFPASDEKAV